MEQTWITSGAINWQKCGVVYGIAILSKSSENKIDLNYLASSHSMTINYILTKFTDSLRMLTASFRGHLKL